MRSRIWLPSAFTASIALSALLSFIAPTIWIGGPALAQECDTKGHGVPGLAHISTTSSTMVISWFLQCAAHPQTMELVQNGTSQQHFQDGQLLGRSSLAPLQNAGAVTAPNLTPDTTFLELRLCATFSDSPPWCTGTFGAHTASGSSGPIGPHNLTVTDATEFVGPGKSHWQPRLILTWQPGSGYPSTTIFFGDSQFTRVDNIPTTASRFDVTNIRLNAVYDFHVCAAGTSPPMCTNTIRISAPALPLPKTPTNPIAIASAAHEVRVSWSPGDDNVTAFYDVQRRDTNVAIIGPGGHSPESWIMLAPRVAAGAPMSLVDNVNPRFPEVPVKPLTYRICAGNARGVGCTPTFQPTDVLNGAKCPPFCLGH